MYASLLGFALLGQASAATVDSRFALGVGGSNMSHAHVAYAHRVSLGFGPGLPRPELAMYHDLSSDFRTGVSGIGVRQPLGDRVSVAAHAGLLSFTGPLVGYDAGFGVDAALSLDLLRRETWGLGLVGTAGTEIGDDRMWGMVATELRFGS